MSVSNKTLVGLAVAAATGATLALLPAAASAAVITFGAALTPGQEVPTPNLNVNGGVATPSGNGTGRLDTDTNLFSGTLDWTGMTSSVTRGHIHAAPPGAAGPILIGYFDFVAPVNQPGAFLPPTGSFALSPIRLTDAQESALLTGLAAGALYFNIHTTQNPAGEIRGNIAAQAIGKVPLPASLALMGAGLLALGMTTRRR